MGLEFKKSEGLTTGKTQLQLYFSGNKTRVHNAKNDFLQVNNITHAPTYAVRAKYLGFSSNSDYFTKKDLLELHKIQANWANNTVINPATGETVNPVRLSPIRLGDVKTMLQLNAYAGFNFGKDANDIHINPIKEIVNASGGKDAAVVHESFHSLNHNLRRALAYQEPDLMLRQAANAVFDRVLTGENGFILSGLKPVTINEQKAYVYDVIPVPQFSKKEKESIHSFIYKLTPEYLALNEVGANMLNQKGRRLLFESVIPQMEEHKQYLDLRGENPKRINAKAYSKVKNYINAMFFRRDFLWGNLFDKNILDINENLSTPLTEAEKTMAVSSLNGLLSTREGNILQEKNKGYSDMANKAYLLSHEERFAREEEIKHMYKDVIEKLKNTKHTESEKISLNNKIERLEKDFKLINLLEEYVNLEKEIISAPKDPKKMARAYRAGDKAFSDEIQNLFKALKKYNVNWEEMRECQTQDDVTRIISESKRKLPEKYHNLFDDFIFGKFNDEILKGSQNIEKTFSPTAILAATSENLELIKKYRGLLKNIKELAKGSEISSLPRFLFKSDKNFIAYASKFAQVTAKWAEKILK